MEGNQKGNEEGKHQDLQNPIDAGKEIDQGLSTPDATPEISRCVVATPIIHHQYSPPGPVDFPSVTSPPTSLLSYLESAIELVPSTQTMQAYYATLASRSLPSTPSASIPSMVSTPSEFSTPKYSISESTTPTVSTSEYSTTSPLAIIPSTTATPLSRQSDGDYTRGPRRELAKYLSTSNDDDDDGRRIEQQIAKEVIVESLIHALKEIPEVKLQKDDSRRSRRRLKRKLAQDFGRKTRRPRRELAKAWKELMSLKQKSEQKQVDKRWNVQQEVANLYDVALKFSYPQFKDEKPKIITCVEEEYGDYQCENVFSIWPKLRREGTMHVGPRRVGWKIKKILQLLRPEMIERTPSVLDAGVLAIKLSGKWMAKSVHKMLRNGIDSWAPKFVMERVIVNFPSCDMANLVPMDLLRRELIKTTSISMLEYCKIGVEFSVPCGMDLPEEENDKFRMKKGDEDVLIYRNNAEGEEEEPLIHAKRDEWSGINPMDDLTDLWYGLEKKKADWIICMTPVPQQEYIKMCIKAARHAEWLPVHICDSPRASYTGYQIFNTRQKHEDLDSLLIAAKMSCEAVAEELGYTCEQVSNCTLKYTILKNNRLADYTFNYEEMIEGNTFGYLLNTLFRIRSFTNESREDIDQLKMDSELTLGKCEIWKEGVERALVQHLLGFTQIIRESCLPVLPHILCEYLYDLSKNFNAVCEACFVTKTTKILLCEATRVVMEKGLQLLGITPESSSLGDVDLSSSGLTKSLFQVQRLNRKDDPPKINTRFEMFLVYPYITRDLAVTDAVMFGTISISDEFGVRSDGWGLTNAPDDGFVTLFDCDGPYSVDIISGRPMYLGNPSCHRLVPFSTDMATCVELYARTECNDDVFELGKGCLDTNFEDFLEDEEADTMRCLWTSSGQDGSVQMYYILLKDAVDSTIKVTYDGSTKDGDQVFAELFAYYGGDFFKEGDPFEKKFYTACLFRNSFDTNIPEIPLDRSMLAVPANGSIVIEATLFDVNSWDVIMSGTCTFLAQSTDNVQTIGGSCGSLRVSVDWSRDC